MADDPLVLLEVADGVARVTLNRPQRHNSLVPELIAALNEALAELRARDLSALGLAGAGRSFSPGGDGAAFHAVPRKRRRAYARALVSGLNGAILSLIDMPFPVIARVHGPVTGGSLGLVLAADLVAIAPPAFIAPYYVEVGFAPDGGWTAMLPQRIGRARAQTIQLLNRRMSPEFAVALGLATELAEASKIDTVIDHWIATLKGKVACGVRATRRLMMPPERRAAIIAGLQRELDAFVEQIDTDEVEAGMAKFLEHA